MAKKRAKTARKSPSAAQKADRHDLYQRAVQCVEAEIDFVDEEYAKLRGRKARLLREDFCGTGNTSCEWVRRRPGNIAVGVDIDPDPMAWGEAHNLSKLSAKQRGRVHLTKGDVLRAGAFTGDDGARAGYDAVLAMNFSYWCFKERKTMLRYFRAVRKSLADDGVFFMDFYGGYESMREMEEPREYRGFTYVWDQAKYDPITGDVMCRIHFRFPDGSRMRNAFEYHWRLWTIPELRDILIEAGFKNIGVYWEGDDGKGEGNGVFTRTTEGEADAAFITYITAEK